MGTFSLKKIKKYRLSENFFNKQAVSSLWRSVTGRSGTMVMPPVGVPKNEIVVLVHGLIHRGAVMRNFGTFLAGHGYTAIIFDYPTTRDDYFGHAKQFHEFLCAILEKYPTQPINIITHSMGGLLARIALTDKINPLPVKRFNRIIMLAPPHRGSEKAKRLVEKMPRLTRALIKPLRDLSSDTASPVHAILWPENYTIGVIAGSYDSSVTPASARAEHQCDFIELPCGHSLMMFNPQIHTQSLYFLEHGKFNH